MSATDTLLNIVYLVLIIGGLLGAIFVGRKGRNKEVQTAMESLNNTLTGEIGGLRRRVDDLEKERATQDRVIATIRYALKHYGLHITISGDFVTLRDVGSGKSMTTPVQDRATVKPLVPPDDDSDAS